MREIRIGLIGLGTIGKLHTLAYRSLPVSVKDVQVTPRLVALLRSRLPAQPDPAGEGYPLVTADPDEFFAQQLDAVDICTPNHLHFSQAKQALAAGAAVYCEKPLTPGWQEAKTLTGLAEARRAVTQVAYVMRYAPGLRQMKSLLEQGLIGDVLHFRGYKYHASYLDTGRPVSWRLRFSQSGGGAFQDLGSHMADLVLYLLGGVARLRMETRTFISQRPDRPGSDRLETVDVDDWAQCILQLPAGGQGEIEVSRVAAGSGESTGLEIYGSRGALAYHSEHPETAAFYDLKHKQWQTRELMPEPVTPGERPIGMLWPEKKFSQGDMFNRHIAAIYDFLLNVAEGKPGWIDFRAATRAQEVVEAAYRSAGQAGSWIDLPLEG